MEKELSFPQIVLGKLRNHVLRHPDLTPYTSVHSKGIAHLNIRAGTIKLLQANREVNLCDLGLSSGFLDATPKAQATKEKS